MTSESDTRRLREWLAAERKPIDVVLACRENVDLDAWRRPRRGAPHVLYRLDGCLADLPPAAILEMIYLAVFVVPHH
ncbi:MAG: hypothetical protein ABI776_17245, partial [Nocardioidaceae bacterium]